MICRSLLLFTVVTLVLASCGQRQSASSELDSSEGTNADIQVVKANHVGNLTLGGLGSPYDLKKCRFFDEQPIQGGTGEFTHYAKADCTEMVEQASGMPLINSYIEPQAWIRKDEQGEVTYAVARHHCQAMDILVAVKETAYNSPVFTQIGFYAKESSPYLTPENDLRFFPKGDSRLNHTGYSTLKADGERVLLFWFKRGGQLRNQWLGVKLTGTP